ncbi:hypothetical protein WJX81_005043 [Elliptochloris bilobata]|uniref:Uncharacterized protein n=1 Tax=Elliptochloris bilobata TaxID=381761 RepID=A0AAW1SHK3_9CHLO
MEATDLLAASKRALLEVASELSGAVLYADAGAGELLQVGVGLPFLYGLGVMHVCALEGARPSDAVAAALLAGKAPVQRLVLLTTQLLPDTHSAALRTLQAHPQARSCLLLCTLCEDAHAGQPATMLGDSAYSTYAAALREDLADVRARLPDEAARGCPNIAVRHLPLHACVLDSGAFVLPAAGAAAAQARLNGGVAGYGWPQAPVAGAAGLDAPGSAGLRLTAHALVGLGAQLGLRLATFSLGPASRLLGNEVCALPAPPGAGEAAALVLLDRGLDLVGPTAHGDHPLDRAYGCLPRRPAGRARPPRSGRVQWRSCDAVVPLEPGCGAPKAPEGGNQPEAQPAAAAGWDRLGDGGAAQGACLAGSLFSPGDAQAGAWREHLMARSGRDPALFLRKWGREALRKENIKPGLRFKAGAAAPAELAALAASLAAEPGAAVRQRPVLQLLAAASAVLAPEPTARWDRLARQERQLYLLAGEGAGAVAGKLADLFRVAGGARAPGALSLLDALQLAAAGYSLAAELGLRPAPEAPVAAAAVQLAGGGDGAAVAASGPFTAEQERGMRDVLVDAVLQADPHMQLLDWLGAGLAAQLLLRHAGDAGSGQQRADAEDPGGPPGGGEALYEAHALRLAVQDKAEEVLERLRAASSPRGRLRELRRLATHGPGSAPVPLAVQVTARAAAGAPTPDLTHNTASLRGLLKSGLGRLGLVQRPPAPGDYDTVVLFVVVLFVVGGIGLGELRAAREAVAERAAAVAASGGRPPPRVILGGTALLAPDDVVAHLLGA